MFLLIFLVLSFASSLQSEELCSFSDEFKGEIDEKVERELKDKALERLIYDYGARYITTSVMQKLYYKRDKEEEFKQILEKRIFQEMLLVIKPIKWNLVKVEKNKYRYIVCVDKEEFQKEAKLLPERIREKREKELQFIYSLYLKAYSQKSDGNIEEAIELFQKGLDEVYKLSAFYDYILINGDKIYLKAELENGYQTSLIQKEEAIKLYENAKIYLNENKLIKARNDLEQASKKYKNYKEKEKIALKLEIKEEEFDKQIQKGKAALENKEYFEAMEIFKKAKEMNVDSQEAKILLEEAEQKYNLAMKMIHHQFRICLYKGNSSVIDNLKNKDDFIVNGFSVAYNFAKKRYKSKAYYKEIFYDSNEMTIENSDFPKIEMKNIGFRFGPMHYSGRGFDYFFEIMAGIYAIFSNNNLDKTNKYAGAAGIGLGYSWKVLGIKALYRKSKIIDNKESNGIYYPMEASSLYLVLDLKFILTY